MTFRICSHEAEIKELMKCGHWPEACSAELRTHAAACRSCSDLLLLEQAFRKARAATAVSASLPPHGAIWWRAQLRRRNAAVERIGRPILGAEIFALSIAVILASGLIVSQGRHGLQWLTRLGEWMTGISQSEAFRLDMLLPSSGWMYLIPILAVLALLSGVVLYLSSEKH